MPSNAKPYVEHWSDDPAFIPAPDADSPEAKASSVKFQNATDTGDWSGLRVEGGPEPVRYTVRPLRTEEYAHLADIKAEGGGMNEVYALAMRIALVSIAGLGAELKFEKYGRLGRIATLSWIEESGMNAHSGLQLVREIGSRIVSRAADVGPL